MVYPLLLERWLHNHVTVSSNKCQMLHISVLTLDSAKLTTEASNSVRLYLHVCQTAQPRAGQEHQHRRWG